MRRVACIALPEVRLEVARERETVAGGALREPARTPHASFATVATVGLEALASWKPEPAQLALAVVVARPGGAVKTERDVLGNTRLDVVSREARALGVRAGQTVAAARAKCSDLRVRVVPEGAVHAALARIAEAALAFGPASGFDVAQDVVWVDVSGCAHLHAEAAANDARPGEARANELALAKALEARVQSLGHACRVAVASGPRIAMAIAKYAAPRRSHGPVTAPVAAPVSPAPVVVPAGGEADAMRALPVAALGLDDDATAWLRDLGLARCGDLQKLPRKSLGVRLGGRVRDVMLLLDGEDRAPLEAWRPPEVPEERVELDWGAASLESLAFVLKALCDRLAARLQGRAMGAARVELVLSLDRALCGEASHRTVFEIVLPVPLAGAADLLAVVRSRLEHATLAAPVLAATLRATELASLQGRTVSWIEPEPAAGRAMPRLVAELSAELGAARVGILELVDTWQPDERTRLAPYGSRPLAASRWWTSAVTSAFEPTRLVPARAVERASMTALLPLARIEGVEWWRRPPRRRDFAAAWMPGVGAADAGARAGATAWVEADEARGDVMLRGWID
jgi:protein ImuB